MTKSLFGSNVDLPYVKDYGRFLEFHHRLDPVAMTLIVDAPEQREKITQTASELSQATHIARVWHPDDGGFYLPPTGPGDTRQEVSSAEDYINEFQAMGKGNMILSVLNEPAADTSLADQVKLVNWCVRAIKRADETETRIILPNWGDLNPFVLNGMWAPNPGKHGINAPADLYAPILQAIYDAKHRDLFYIGMHLYGPDKYLSPLQGYVGLCDYLGMRPPPVYITEWGMDTVNVNEHIDGYKDRLSGGDYARWNADQLDVPLRPFVEAGIVLGFTLFGYGHTLRWVKYDTENDHDEKAPYSANDHSYQGTMVALKNEGKLFVAVKPVAQSVAKPTHPGQGRKVICRLFRNIRSGPSTRYHDDGDLPAGTPCTIFDQAPMVEIRPDGSRVSWWWMESEKGNGWIQSTGWKWENAAVDPVQEPVPVPPVVTPQPPASPVKQWAIGLQIAATAEQKDILIAGLEHLLLACAMIGQATGTEITFTGKEIIA